MRWIAPSAVIHPNVVLGEDCVVEDYVILGHPPRGARPGDLPLVIGAGAVIRSHTVIYAGSVIGNDFATGHGTLIREHNRIGDSVSVGSHSVIEFKIEIGARVRIHSQAFIPEFTRLEEECWIGPSVALTNVLHPCCPKAKECIQGPTLRRGVKVGANATILPAVEIGAGTLVGAGAVVVSSLPEGVVVAGNPARILKGIEELGCPFGLIEHPYKVK